jgi:hypothetical protein
VVLKGVAADLLILPITTFQELAMINFKLNRMQRTAAAIQCFTAVALITGAGISGCASKSGYNSAFAGSTALVGNSHRYDANPDQTFKTVKITLVQQGFTIEQADAINGLIKGARALQDPKDKKISYLVTASIDVTGVPSGDATVVTASASQQTVLHKDSEKYFHLLGLVPIPTGKDYQTIVRKEGNITDAMFYKDLFAAITNNLPKKPPAVATIAAPAVVVTVAPVISPAPTGSAPVAAAPAPADNSAIAPTPTSGVTPEASAPTNTTAIAPKNL